MSGPWLRRPPQRWAVAAAWIAFLSTVPSALWRIVMVAGVDVGYAKAGLYVDDPEGTPYVIALDVIQMLAGTLCLGLIARWGERVPRWAPGLGGRIIPTWLPLLLGGLGAAAILALYVFYAGPFALVGLGPSERETPIDGTTGWGLALWACCYAPILLWAPALIVALVGYARRRLAGDESRRPMPAR